MAKKQSKKELTAAEIGRRGGKATAAHMTKAERIERARKAGKARQAKAREGGR